MLRYAIIRNARSRSEAEAYLPSNYVLIHEGIERKEEFNCVAPGGSTHDDALVFVIEGKDVAGWTLGYVIDRYASGLIQAQEIDLSHPIMKTIPLSPYDRAAARRRRILDEVLGVVGPDPDTLTPDERAAAIGHIAAQGEEAGFRPEVVAAAREEVGAA